jgi:hypothetical protein
MIAVVLLLLLVVWAAVLIPPWIRARAEHSPESSIAGFNRRLSVLASRSSDPRPLPGFSDPIPVIPPVAYGGFAMQPLRKSEAQRRRALILECLLIGAGCTLVLSFLPPLSFIRVFFILDLVALVGYVGLLLQWKRNRLERREKVRPIATRSVSPQPSFAYFERQAR